MNKSTNKLVKFIASCVFVTTMISIPILVSNPNQFALINNAKLELKSFRKSNDITSKDNSNKNSIDKVTWDDLSYNYNIQVWEEKPRNGNGTERIWDPSNNNCQIKYNIGKYPIDATNNLISVDKSLDNTSDSIIATTGTKTIQQVGFNKIDTDPSNENQHYGVGKINLRNKSNSNQESPIIEIKRDAIFPDNKMDLVRANSSMDLNLDLKINLFYNNGNDVYIDDDRNNGLVTLKFNFDGSYLDPAKPSQGIEHIYEIGQVFSNKNTIKTEPLKINVHQQYSDSINQTFKMEFNPFLLKVRLDYEKLSISIVDEYGNIFNQENLEYFIDKNEKDSLPVEFNPSAWKANVRINNARYQIKPSQSVNDDPALMQISDKPYEMYAPVDKSILDGSNPQNQKGMMTKEQWERGNEINILEPIEHTIYAPFEISFKPQIINNEVQQILYVNENGSGWKMVSADSSTGIQKYSSYNSYMEAIKNKQFGDMTFEVQVRQNTSKKSRAGESNFKQIVYYRKFKLNINSAQMEFKLHGWEDINEFDKRKYLAKTMEELEKPISYDSKAFGNSSNNNKNKPNPNYRSYLDPDTGMYFPQIAWVNERSSNGFLLDPFDKYGNKIDIDKNDDLLTPGYIAQLNAPAIYSVDLTESAVKAGAVDQITNINYESTKVVTKNEYKIIDDLNLDLKSFYSENYELFETINGGNLTEIDKLNLYPKFLESINAILYDQKNDDSKLNFIVKSMPEDASFQINSITPNYDTNTLDIEWQISSYFNKGDIVNKPLVTTTKIKGFKRVSNLETILNIRKVYFYTGWNNIFGQKIKNFLDSLSQEKNWNNFKDMINKNMYVVNFNPDVINGVNNNTFEILSINFENKNQALPENYEGILTINWKINEYKNSSGQTVTSPKEGTTQIVFSDKLTTTPIEYKVKDGILCYKTLDDATLIESTSRDKYQITPENVSISKSKNSTIKNNSVVSTPGNDASVSNDLIYKYVVKIKSDDNLSKTKILQGGVSWWKI